MLKGDRMWPVTVLEWTACLSHHDKSGIAETKGDIQSEYTSNGWGKLWSKSKHALTRFVGWHAFCILFSGMMCFESKSAWKRSHWTSISAFQGKGCHWDPLSINQYQSYLISTSVLYIQASVFPGTCPYKVGFELCSFWRFNLGNCTSWWCYM